MYNPKFRPCREAGVESWAQVGLGFLLCSLNGSSAAAPSSPSHGTIAQPGWTHLALSRAASNHKGISILFAFPGFVSVGAGRDTVTNQAEFWGCIEELFLFQ